MMEFFLTLLGIVGIVLLITGMLWIVVFIGIAIEGMLRKRR